MATLAAPPDVIDRPGLPDALATALGVPLTDVRLNPLPRTRPAGAVNTGDGSLTAFIHPGIWPFRRGVVRGCLTLSRLGTALEAAGCDRLTIGFGHPDVAYVDFPGSRHGYVEGYIVRLDRPAPVIPLSYGFRPQDLAIVLWPFWVVFAVAVGWGEVSRRRRPGLMSPFAHVSGQHSVPFTGGQGAALWLVWAQLQVGLWPCYPLDFVTGYSPLRTLELPVWTWFMPAIAIAFARGLYARGRPGISPCRVVAESLRSHAVVLPLLCVSCAVMSIWPFSRQGWIEAAAVASIVAWICAARAPARTSLALVRGPLRQEIEGLGRRAGIDIAGVLVDDSAAAAAAAGGIVVRVPHALLEPDMNSAALLSVSRQIARLQTGVEAADRRASTAAAVVTSVFMVAALIQKWPSGPVTAAYIVLWGGCLLLLHASRAGHDTRVDRASRQILRFEETHAAGYTACDDRPSSRDAPR